MAAPWADVVYAMDRQWWVKYRAVVSEQCEGLRVSPLTGLPGVNKVFFNHFQNSGAGAISLAAHWGAKRIILIGYDCQKTGGKSHWHGDHPKGLGNAGTIATWPGQFAKMAKELKGPEIINCSRETALTMFERRQLAEVLNERP